MIAIEWRGPGVARTWAAVAAFSISLSTADAASGQAALPPVQNAAEQVQQPLDSLTAGISPSGAFVRSLLVPGWGHSRLGVHGRGGFYIASDGGIALMILKTRSKLRHARDAVIARERLARARLERDGVTDPEALDAGVDDDEGVVAARGLVEAREGQQEDWAALGVFFILLGGVDAYVSAHLGNFPEPLGIAPGAEGGIELSISLPIGRR